MLDLASTGPGIDLLSELGLGPRFLIADTEIQPAALAVTSAPGLLAAFILMILMVRGGVVWLREKFTPTASDLSTATEVAVDSDLMLGNVAPVLVAAGVISVTIFPALARCLPRRTSPSSPTHAGLLVCIPRTGPKDVIRLCHVGSASQPRQRHEVGGWAIGQYVRMGTVALLLGPLINAVLIAVIARRLLGAPVGWPRTLVIAISVSVLANPPLRWIVDRLALATDGGPGASAASVLVIAATIASLVAVEVGIMVVLEALVPTGSLPGPWDVLRALPARWRRTKRYAVILRIAGRHGFGAVSLPPGLSGRLPTG
ncbi:MAG: hypothetical protein WBB15_00295 [Ornithinimicrobium sp.]